MLNIHLKNLLFIDFEEKQRSDRVSVIPRLSIKAVLRFICNCFL